jgi:hypothetical protein
MVAARVPSTPRQVVASCPCGVLFILQKFNYLFSLHSFFGGGSAAFLVHLL